MIHWWRPARREVVAGGSMHPALQPGDRVLVVWAPRYRSGDIVAMADPRLAARTLIKRVGEVTDGGRALLVFGDRPAASTDSRTFGPVRRSKVYGRVVYRYFPPSRVGRLGRSSAVRSSIGERCRRSRS